MKKILYILFAVCLFTACSSDDDNTTPTTDPQKGDDVTIEQIIGKYELSDLNFDNGNLGTFEDKIQLTFNADKSGEEFNPRTLKKASFNWSYNNRVINFTHSVHGSVSGWFDKSTLKYKTYAKPEYPNEIGTYFYKKIN